ncbi:hypothetical protein BdWA1_001484 [Babesia duncani]|uniref:Uncharacterized protein n=1 Tax=Babesia duncani TaxID=323732 RepID=A0AAD9PPB3_9APIC|nr:hypothetical protein BdWA1_001484 [Babesia duncani]
MGYLDAIESGRPGVTSTELIYFYKASGALVFLTLVPFCGNVTQVARALEPQAIGSKTPQTTSTESNPQETHTTRNLKGTNAKCNPQQEAIQDCFDMVFGRPQDQLEHLYSLGCDPRQIFFNRHLNPAQRASAIETLKQCLQQGAIPSKLNVPILIVPHDKDDEKTNHFLTLSWNLSNAEMIHQVNRQLPNLVKLHKRLLKSIKL